MFGLTKEQQTIASVLGVAALIGVLLYNTSKAQKKADEAHTVAVKAYAEATARATAAAQAQAQSAAAAAEYQRLLQEQQRLLQSQFDATRAEIDTLSKQLPGDVPPAS